MSITKLTPGNVVTESKTAIMMRKIITALISIVALVCHSAKCDSQVIISAEYFVNTDPGVGNGVPLLAIGILGIDKNFSISAKNLQPGFNRLFIRVIDQNGNWSIAEQRPFYIDNNIDTLPPSIAKGEYYFDADPGAGNGLPLSIVIGDSVSSDLHIGAAGLANGFHQLFIRVQDQSGNWSIAEQRTFYIDNTLRGLAPLTSAEYFVDTDPGIGSGIPLTVPGADSVGTVFYIKTAGLPVGFHQLFIRIKDQNNNWSISEQRTFLLDSNLQVTDSNQNAVHNPIVAAEYFVNSDPGVINSTPIPVAKGDSVDANFNYVAPNLSLGNYTVSVRVKDSTGRWSIAETRPFIVCTNYAPISNFDVTVTDTVAGFTNTSSYGTTYHWNFGDGDTSNAFNPVHAYKPGTYTACLITTNECLPGGDTVCKLVSVGTLPVILADFRLTCTGNQVLLTWQTATEANSKGFEVQTSNDGVADWHTIGSLSASGNSTSVKNYHFANLQNNSSFYRLKLIDRDGVTTYSEVRRSNCADNKLLLTVYPVPTKNVINLLIQTTKSQSATILLTDVYGQATRKLDVKLQKGTNTQAIRVSELASGDYFIKVEGQDGVKTQKVIISH